MTIPELHQLFLNFPYVSTDSRAIIGKSIFFALKGDHFNGNSFAMEALKKGAAYAIVDESAYATTPEIILVDDVLKTLQQLASFHRNYCNTKIIALTGSNGKTTTKELMYTVLSQKYKTIATKGNLNNHIGVPLTLLSLQKETELAVVEMGANHLEEIAFLSNIAQPNYGYITNFGKAHLEGFGSEAGIIKGKSELYDFLTSHNGVICMNADDPIQKDKLKGYGNAFGFSEKKSNYYHIEFLEANPFVHLNIAGTTIQSLLIGRYNFPNCAAAIAFGLHFEVPLSDIKSAIESYEPQNNRSQILMQNGHKIILDAYNANPTSMAAALESFSLMEGVEKVLFLGDMFELGFRAAEEHQKIADLANQLKFKNVNLIGKNFSKTHTNFQKFDTFETLKEAFGSLSLAKSTFLIKGSRGMALERILTLL